MPSTKMERYCANIAQSHVTGVRFRYNNTPPKSIEQFKNENSKCKEQRHHVNTQQHLLRSSSASFVVSINQASQSIKPNPPHQPTQQDNHHYILYLMPGPPAKRKSPPKDDERKPAAKKTKSAKGKDARGKDTQTKGPKPHQNRRSDDGNRGNEVHPPPIVSPIGKENIRGEFSEDQGGDVGTNQERPKISLKILRNLPSHPPTLSPKRPPRPAPRSPERSLKTRRWLTRRAFRKFRVTKNPASS